MSAETDRLVLHWRQTADQHERDATAYRLMSSSDGANGRSDMKVRNLKVAAHAQGKADGLREAARQLSAVSVRS